MIKVMNDTKFEDARSIAVADRKAVFEKIREKVFHFVPTYFLMMFTDMLTRLSCLTTIGTFQSFIPHLPILAKAA